MNQSIHSKRPDRTPWVPAKRNRAFTLVELLVVLAILALLTATLLPALAGTKINTKRIQCLSNLHQLYAACTMYAGDFNNWYPIWYQPDGGAHPVNVLKSEVYGRYVFGANGDPNKQIPQMYMVGGGVAGFASGPGNCDQNLGYLYAGGFIADGKAMWCPAFSSTSGKTNLLSWEQYANPIFFSTDSSGNVRSSYEFNPRRANTAGGNYLRRYQKTSDPKVRDVFITDFMEAPNGLGPPTGVPFTPQYWAHWPAEGLLICYTDGSASLVFSQNGFTLATKNLVTGESALSAQLYDILWNDYRDAQ